VYPPSRFQLSVREIKRKMEIRRLKKKSGGPKKGKTTNRRMTARRIKRVPVEDFALP
jgi:hypothetical protein